LVFIARSRAPSQSRRPVRRRTALRTRRRSRPLSVRPAPSSTELCAAARRATISWGGSAGSSPPPACAHLPRRASDGIRTGADLAIPGPGAAADRATPARFDFLLPPSSSGSAARSPSPRGDEPVAVASQRTSSSRRSPPAATVWAGVGGRESRRRSMAVAPGAITSTADLRRCGGARVRAWEVGWAGAGEGGRTRRRACCCYRRGISCFPCFADRSFVRSRK
jgi:hypothetical protein